MIALTWNGYTEYGGKQYQQDVEKYNAALDELYEIKSFRESEELHGELDTRTDNDPLELAELIVRFPIHLNEIEKILQETGGPSLESLKEQLKTYKAPDEKGQNIIKEAINTLGCYCIGIKDEELLRLENEGQEIDEKEKIYYQGETIE